MDLTTEVVFKENGKLYAIFVKNDDKYILRSIKNIFPFSRFSVILDNVSINKIIKFVASKPKLIDFLNSYLSFEIQKINEFILSNESQSKLKLKIDQCLRITSGNENIVKMTDYNLLDLKDKIVTKFSTKDLLNAKISLNNYYAIIDSSNKLITKVPQDTNLLDFITLIYDITQDSLIKHEVEI